MKDGKLYIKSICMICIGKKIFCPYCEGGSTYIEAADKIIKEWLKNQTEDVKKYITGAGDEEK